MHGLEQNVGIIGCGHLGLTFAKRLVACGFPNTQIRLSYRGAVHTRERLDQAGLAANVVTTHELCRRSDLIFIAIKPSDLTSLDGLRFRDETTIVSCIAGVRIASLQKHLRHDVVRLMPCSPLTIEAGEGVAALYPPAGQLQELLSWMGFKIYQIPAEDIFHLFTATVCLPAAFVFLEQHRRTLDEAAVLNHFGRAYDLFTELYYWAQKTTPRLDDATAVAEYLGRMATKGGITERMLNRLREGGSLCDALRDGIGRSREIADSLTG